MNLDVRDPSGARVATARVDALRPVASVEVAPLAEGAYAVRVTGVGASETVDGVRYGAGYALTVEVAFG